MEKLLNRENKYQGKILDLCVDDVIIDDKDQSIREVILHNGGVCIALKDLSDNKYFLVKQYRYVQKREMLEFAAGKIEKDEDVDLAIKREAKEELGYEVNNLKKLGKIIPTCAYSSEVIHLYYGETGKYVGQDFDEDERIEVLKYSFNEIKELIKKGIIEDAKTIALMYHIEIGGIDA